jgi:hypothetical protein
MMLLHSRRYKGFCGKLLLVSLFLFIFDVALNQAFAEDPPSETTIDSSLATQPSGTEPFLDSAGEPLAITEIRNQIYDRFGVTVLPHGTSFEYRNKDNEWVTGVSYAWRAEDLRLLANGYEILRTAVRNAVGEENLPKYAFIWGSGRKIARFDRPKEEGEFGYVHSDLPTQVNVTVDLVEAGFAPQVVAERIAHENAHATNFLIALERYQDAISWTETEFARIFEFCRISPGPKTSLKSCRNKKPRWFNFHPSDYAARNSSEFYGKMVEQWVRESLGRDTRGHYRCQTPETQIFWREMTTNLLSLSAEKPCR